MASTAGAHSPPQPGYASPPQQPYAAYLSGAQQQLYQQAAANVRPGTLPPGVCVKIGEHEVTIERFLSEGTFTILLPAFPGREVIDEEQLHSAFR